MKKFKLLFIISLSILFLSIGNKCYANGTVTECNSELSRYYDFSILMIKLNEEEVFCIDHGYGCSVGKSYYLYGTSQTIKSGDINGDKDYSDVKTGYRERFLSNIIDSSFSTYKAFEKQGISINAKHVVQQYLIWQVMDGAFDDYDDEKISKVYNLYKDTEMDADDASFAYGRSEDEAVYEVLESHNTYISDKDREMILKVNNILGGSSSILSAFSIIAEFVNSETKNDIFYYQAEENGNQRLITTIEIEGTQRTVTPKARYFLNDDSDPVYVITGDEISVNETKDFRYDDKDSYVSQGDYDKLMSAYYSGAEEKEANSSNNYTVDFYFKLYLIKVHHYLNVLDSNENPTWSECTNEPDYIYLLVGDDEKSDTLVGDYYDFKKYIENHESESGDLEKLTVSFDGSYYSVRLNEHKSSSEVLEINIDYEPRSFIFNSSKLL